MPFDEEKRAKLKELYEGGTKVTELLKIFHVHHYALKEEITSLGLTRKPLPRGKGGTIPGFVSVAVVKALLVAPRVKPKPARAEPQAEELVLIHRLTDPLTLRQLAEDIRAGRLQPDPMGICELLLACAVRLEGLGDHEQTKDRSVHRPSARPSADQDDAQAPTASVRESSGDIRVAG